MKSKYLIQIAMTTIFASIGAQAAAGLEGEYKFAGFECSSGAPAKSPLVGDGLAGKFRMSISITSNQITTNIKLVTKMSEAKGQEYIKLYQDAIAQMSQSPEGPQKQQYLEEMKKGMEGIQKLVAGSSCKTTSVLNYSVSGNTVHTVPVSTSGTCQSPESKEAEAVFNVDGNSLKITNQSAADECPAGDMVTSVYKRVQ